MLCVRQTRTVEHDTPGRYSPHVHFAPDVMDVDDDGDDSVVEEGDDLGHSRLSAMSSQSVESQCFCVWSICSVFAVHDRFTCFRCNCFV